MTPVFAFMFGRLLNAFFSGDLRAEVNRLALVLTIIAGAAGVAGARRPGAELRVRATCLRHPYQHLADIQPPPTSFAGTLQVACLQWAGARQANRVRRRYLAALLAQVRPAGGELTEGQGLDAPAFRQNEHIWACACSLGRGTLGAHL